MAIRKGNMTPMKTLAAALLVTSTLAVGCAPTLSNTGNPTNASGDTQKYDLLFQTYGTHFGVDPLALKALAKVESGLNPRTETGPYKGLFQITREQCESTRLAMPDRCDNLFDAEVNTAVAAKGVTEALRRITAKCPKLDTESTLRLLYVSRNNGPGVMAYVLDQSACQLPDQEHAVRAYGPAHPESRYAKMVSPDHGAMKWAYGANLVKAFRNYGGTSLLGDTNH